MWGCAVGSARRSVRRWAGAANEVRADVARDVAALGLVFGGRPAPEEVAVAGVAEAPQREFDTIMKGVEPASHGLDDRLEPAEGVLVPEERWERARGGRRGPRRRAASGWAGRGAHRGSPSRKQRERGVRGRWESMMRSKTGMTSVFICTAVIEGTGNGLKGPARAGTRLRIGTAGHGHGVGLALGSRDRW